MCRESSCIVDVSPLPSALQSGSPSCRAGGSCSDAGLEEVPELLEEMNYAAAEVNSLEQASAGAMGAYQARLTHWNELHQHLRKTYGTRAFDRASRLLHAEEAFEESWKSVEKATAAYSLAAESTCQNTRQTCEGDCVRTLAVFQEAKSHYCARQATLGEKGTRLLPQLRQLLLQRAELAQEQDRLGELGLRAKASKLRYGSSMSQLERISEAIHHQRQQARILSSSSFGSTSDGSPDGCSEEISQAAQTARKSCSPEESEASSTSSFGSREIFKLAPDVVLI